MERWIPIGLGIAALGGISIYVGTGKLRLALQSSATPQEITLAELIARGPRENLYVRIRDFHIDAGGVEVGRKKEFVKHAYVPMWPTDGAGVAVLKTHSFNGLFFSSEGPLEGMVTGESLDATTRQVLAKEFPGKSFQKALIVDSSQKRPSAGEGWAFVVFGAVLVMPLLSLLIYAFILDRRERRAAIRANQGQ